MSQKADGSTIKPAGSRRRGRVIFLIVLIAGFIGAGSALWPWLTGSSAGSDATVKATVTVSAPAAPTASAMTSDEARAEYYRLHPKTTGWWQWPLIGGLLLLLVAIGVVLLRAPPKEPEQP